GEIFDVLKLEDVAIDAGADETLLVDGGEGVLVLALLAADEGREDHHLRAGGVLHHGIGDLAGGLAGDLAAALPAVGGSRAGEEDAEVVVDLSCRRDGGARIGTR